MGRPKAWLPWHGLPMVAHVVDVMREVTDDVVVVTSEAVEVPEVAARVVRDEQPGLGPLAGLAAGFAHARGALCFATSTDAPFLTAAFARAVLAVGSAAAPVAEGHVQTLAAAYPREAALREARALLADGRRRPLDLLERLDYRPLAAESLPDPRALEDFNTPGEYLAAVADAAAGGASAPVTLEFLGEARSLAGRNALEVPAGLLGEVLAHRSAPAGLLEDGQLAPRFLVSLGGRDFVRDLGVPIGPGERVVVLDAAAGG